MNTDDDYDEEEEDDRNGSNDATPLTIRVSTVLWQIRFMYLSD